MDTESPITLELVRDEIPKATIPSIQQELEDTLFCIGKIEELQEEKREHEKKVFSLLEEARKLACRKIYHPSIYVNGIAMYQVQDKFSNLTEENARRIAELSGREGLFTWETHYTVAHMTREKFLKINKEYPGTITEVHEVRSSPVLMEAWTSDDKVQNMCNEMDILPTRMIKRKAGAKCL